MKKIIYVPGFTGRRRDTQGLKIALRGYNVIYFEGNPSLRESSKKTGYRLWRFINEEIEWEDGEMASIIGVSAGGMPVKDCLVNYPNERIDKAIFMCTPWKGTWLASVPTRRDGLIELRRNSPYLIGLAKKKLENVAVESFWSPLDFVVIPGNSARGTNPIACYFPHPIMHFCPTALMKIRRLLES